MTTIQVRVDDAIKISADSLFCSLGLDTSTAIRMFLSAAIERNGIPFTVRHKRPNDNLQKAINDTRTRRNLHGPYKTAEEAVAAMLEN